MRPIIYADVLFVVNFLINLTLLKITAVLLKRTVSTTRLCVASVLGAVYAVCMFFPDIEFLYIFPFKIIISVILVRIISPKCSVLRLIKSSAIFFLVSFTFAGVLLSLIYFTDFASGNGTVVSNGIFYFNISLKMLVFASVISYGLITVSTSFFRKSKLLGIKKIKIILGKNECEITALPDTGNLLVDPISKSPVIIAEKKHIQSLFPDGVPCLESAEDYDVRIRLIPYNSIGKSNGLLTGFVPDSITIEGKIIQHAIIAISENCLSPSDEYNALFNPNIIISEH